MSDTVKLIVEISTPPMNDHERWALACGTLLDTVKAEIAGLPTDVLEVCELKSRVLHILDNIREVC